jgi:archaetidylinositol phosphate synthase
VARPVTKIDPSLLTPLARAMGRWIIPRTPRWVTPNQVTIGGFVVNVIGSLSFLFAGANPNLLFIAILCLVLNWLADNLDGELARARGMTSERGFYLDVVIDQIGVMCVTLGIAFSANAYNLPYLLLLIISYPIMTHVTLMHVILRQRFPLGRLSPAEGRLGLIILALLVYFRPGPVFSLGGMTFGWFEIGTMLTLPLAIGERIIGGVQLYYELDPPGSSRPVPLNKSDPSLLTPLSERLIAPILPLLPPWITPNLVTFACFATNLLGGLAFYLASFDRNWFFVAIACLLFHWYGDNLDGQLARARKLTSERGFYLDLMLDLLGVTAFAIGLAFANYANLVVVMLAIIAYQILFHLSLMEIVMRRRLDLGRFGPAEGRFALVVLALLTYFFPAPLLSLGSVNLGWFDLGVSLVTWLALLERAISAIKLYRSLKPPLTQ